MRRIFLQGLTHHFHIYPAGSYQSKAFYDWAAKGHQKSPEAMFDAPGRFFSIYLKSVFLLFEQFWINFEWVKQATSTLYLF